MKTLISVASLAVAAGCVSTIEANPGTSGQTQPTLTWNRIALEAVERAKPTQHQAIRLLAHVSLAQYAALAHAENDADSREGVATASSEVIAGLMPSQAAFVEERHRELQARADENGRRIAQRVLAEAGQDGFAKTWSGQVPQAAYAWRSLVNPPAPPAYPAVGAMRTFLVESGRAFAPPLLPRSAVRDLSRILPKCDGTPNHRPRIRRGSRSSTT
jgi:hypothetical protein